MKIRWIGHASFHIETATGVKIRTDPYDESIGLPLSKLPADVVTISHEHFDHNAVDAVPGNLRIIRPATPPKNMAATVATNVTLFGIPTFHDNVKGAKRGSNTVFVIEADGVRLVHLGDLGHLLTPSHLTAIGKVDILCVPVGGVYTIDATAATIIADATKALVVIPMHYKIPGLNVGVATVDTFLLGKPKVRRADEITVTPDTLPASPEVVVLAPRP